MLEKRRSLERLLGPVSRETFDRLERFEAAFLKWNRQINLAAQSTQADVWERHILDSAQVVALGRDSRRWVDLGTGGGFPGAIVAILLSPACTVHLVESNRKKAAFLRTTLLGLQVGAKVHAERIEVAFPQVGDSDIVSARALAPLARLLEYASPWTENGARCLFQKGRDYQREVEESSDDWEFDLIEHASSTAEAAVILEISNIRRRT